MQAASSKTRDMAQIALFAVVIALCAWISVPAAVPFTMQTFGVFLAIGVLGGKKGTIAVCVYLCMGVVGIPVFAGGNAGPGALLGSTGGYMASWVVAGLIMWGMERLFGPKPWVLALGMVLGLAACYTLGTAWFMYFYAQSTGPIGLATALGWCVFPYVVPDLVKIALALIIRKRLSAAIRIR